MIRYALRRLVGVVPLVVGVATLIFFVLHLAPGDPTSRYIGPAVPPEVIDRIRTNLGLDDPVPVRYVKWMGSMARGDFGWSLGKSRPVGELIAEILPNTLLLSGSALALAFAVGIAVGVLQAVRHHSLLDEALGVISLVFYSMPSFWLALMLVLVFGLHASVAGWPVSLPPSGMESVDYAFLSPAEKLLDRLRHMILPASTLVLVLSAGIARHTRSSVLEVIRQDYVRTAWAKGLSPGRVIVGHALRNALGPIVTLVGLYLPLLFSGTVFVEVVFGWPGMGQLLVEAVGQRDYPVVMAGSVVFACLVVGGNLLADLLYAVVDPRVRYE